MTHTIIVLEQKYKYPNKHNLKMTNVYIVLI